MLLFGNIKLPFGILEQKSVQKVLEADNRTVSLIMWNAVAIIEIFVDRRRNAILPRAIRTVGIK